MSKAFTPETKKTEQVIFFLSLGSAAFWVIGKVMDIYQIAVLGAIYELLWLPFLALLFGVPVASLILWAKGKFKVNSLYLYSFLISALLLGWRLMS